MGSFYGRITCNYQKTKKNPFQKNTLHNPKLNFEVNIYKIELLIFLRNYVDSELKLKYKVAFFVKIQDIPPCYFLFPKVGFVNHIFYLTLHEFYYKKLPQCFRQWG